MTPNELDDYFGLCPKCHETDGCLNVGRSHWYYCKVHKVKWCVGSNLFSSWRDQTEEEQRRIYNEVGMGGFEEVEPFAYPRPPEPREHPPQNVSDDEISALFGPPEPRPNLSDDEILF